MEMETVPSPFSVRLIGASMLPSIPPHSLVSFGVFLRLPGYADVLLKERRKAQCLLRLVLGVTDDGEGGTPPLRDPCPHLTDYNIRQWPRKVSMAV